jgi:fucose permease
MSGMFAIALIITNQHFPEHTKRVTCILLASNALGGSLIPLLLVGVWIIIQTDFLLGFCYYNAYDVDSCHYKSRKR